MARKKTNLAFEAENYIRNEILTYKLKPGSVLSDNKIALEMQSVLGKAISRSPVREALHKLQAEGIVEIINERFCVSRISFQDIAEICQVREAIEQQAVSIVLDKGGYSKKQIAKFEEYVNELIEQSEKHDEKQEYFVDDEFHSYLVACSGNGRLNDISHMMRIQLVRVRWLNAMFPTRRQEANEEHIEILNALKAGDHAAAQRAITKHNQNILTAFHRFFESPELQNAIVSLFLEENQ